jgi:MFS family permease
MDRKTLRNIILYFTVDIGTFVSVWFFVLDNSLITYTLTQSPFALGLIGFAQNIPFLLFSMEGGLIADRHDRRLVVIFFNLCLFVVTLAAIILRMTGFLSFPVIIFLELVYGTIWACNLPSMIGLVKDLVSDEREFARVMGAAASNGKIGQLGAASVFGYLYTVFTAVGVFFTGLLFNGIALIAALNIRNKPQVIVKSALPLKEQILVGLRYVLENPPLIMVILLSTIISIVFGLVLFQYPVIDSDFLHGNKMFLSALYFAGGIGGLTSGIYMLRRKSPKKILWFLVACTFISGISVLVLALSRDIYISTLCAAGIDFAFIGAMGVSNTVLQLLTDEPRRGRVLGVNTMGSWGIMAIAMAAFGALATVIGIEYVLLIAGALCFVVGMVYVISLPWQKPKLGALYRERGIPDTEGLV